MLCDRCNKKKATIFYRENLGGRVKALHLCGECVEILEQAGELEDISAAVAGFISPFFVAEELSIPIPFPSKSYPAERLGGSAPQKKCPTCGASAEDINRAGRVGCAHCYTAFSEELCGVMTAAHGRAEHTGRVTSAHRAKAEKAVRLTKLKKQLKDAVTNEQYEIAAGLRDQIRGLEAEL